MAGKKEEQSQVRTILADTIIALCKNTLGYRAEVCVEGLLGITLDNEDIFLVNIKETIKKQGADVTSGEREGAEVSDSEGSSSGESHGEDSESKSRRRKRKRRKRSRDNENMTLALESESIDDSDKRQKLETAGDSENDNMAKNVKHESANYDDEDDELVFVKEEPVEDSNSSFGHSQMLGFDGGQSGDSLVETSISAAQLQQLTSQLAASGSTSMDSAVPGTSSQLSGSPGGSTGQYGPPLDTQGSQHWNMWTPDTRAEAVKTPKYFCEKCGRAFQFKAYYDRHVLIHTGEKPFKCNYCDKACNRKSNLKKHVFLVHRDIIMKGPNKESFTAQFCSQ